MTPLDFSFDYVMARSEKPPLSIVEFVIDMCYVVDIIVGFLTSFIDPFTGDEYFSCNKIAWQYIF